MNEQELSVWKALADPARFEILSVLAEGERCVCQLETEIALSQGTLSHHLKVLAQEGLVTRRQEGKWAHFSLNPQKLRDMAERLSAMAADAETAPPLETPACANSATAVCTSTQKKE